jgi:hypothetical protein
MLGLHLVLVTPHMRFTISIEQDKYNIQCSQSSEVIITSSQLSPTSQGPCVIRGSSNDEVRRSRG